MILTILLTVLLTGWESGIATLMMRDHIMSGGPVACRNHPKVKKILPYDGKIRNDFALAALRNSKKYPCGSLIEVVLPRTKRKIIAMVVDRGTAGVACNGKRRLATRKELNSNVLPDNCQWNASIDLNLGAYQAVNGDGYELMKWRPLDLKLRKLKP